MTMAGFGAEAALWVDDRNAARHPQHCRDRRRSAKTRGSSAFVMGLNDLAKETRALHRPGRAAFHAALSLAVIAARAEGLVAIDGVYQRHRRRRRLRSRMPPRARVWLRRQDADPPQPDRRAQRGLCAVGGRGRPRPRRDRRVRAAGKCRQGRHQGRWQDDRTAAPEEAKRVVAVCVRSDRRPQPNDQIQSRPFLRRLPRRREIAHATPRTLTEADAALNIALTGSRYALFCG